MSISALNKSVHRLQALAVVLFVTLCVGLSSVQFFARPSLWEKGSPSALGSNNDLRQDPRNPRILIERYSRPRGSIVARGSDGATVTLASSTKDENGYYTRSYADGPLYSHVTGYISMTQQASTGLEQTEDSVLTGRAQSLWWSRLRDAIRNQNQRGGSIETTIDPKIQKAAQEALGNRSGSVVAMDPRTGAILALVSTPTFDPNPLASLNSSTALDASKSLAAQSGAPLVNRALNGQYAPGSTFKILTAAAGIRSGKVKPDTQVSAPDRITLPGTNHQMENYAGESCGNGVVSLSYAFARSCNTPFAQLGMDVGEKSLRAEAEAWGFNSQVSVPLHVTDSVYTPNGDDQARTALAGIGQGGVTSTPLMMAMVAATVANQGQQMQPHLISRVLDQRLNTVQKTQPQVLRTPISKDTAKSLSTMMQQVVGSGTGTTAQVAGVTVAGKTGTAESDSQQAGDGPTTWFIGFAGTDIAKPTIALAVVLDSGPQTNHGTGGSLAGPIAAQVIDAAVDQ
ncbi:Penicillin-binding protein A [Actinomyces bovis]|uniref:Penicillin-binding protein A n=1 Tax=Actinomyces bovis TaxID=1658 RepID=A0ABY1VRL1_9ACTO|nr:penicillin-binding transpeptidase domain-containing protein [Actinomyces bovis]SPT54382.1 Penicillin-binding protein A [Actinomyces bovis]VEG56071.1 Penicillin-binding protein A [Actinomyces israelii]